MMNIPAIYLQLLICLLYSHVWKENENDYLDNPIYEHFSLEPKYYESATVYMSLTQERPQPTPKYNLLEREYIIQALQDAAFMLRGHKFFEYDRRVYRGEVRNLSAKLLYRQFPIPPLRRLHQKIRHVCGVSLFDCVTYLQKVAHHTQFVRQDFPGTLTFNEFKNITINETLLKAADKECVLRRHSDYVHAFPFREPLERFQWRASASYFMCFFAMAQLDEIEKFHEPCDNFGGCIDPVFGIHNKDVRANDSAPFSCATYSFCPDPCCARYLKSYEDCWEDTSNPCYDIALPGARQCKVNPEENHNFNAMVKNHWNITCNCPDEGYKFKSVFGFCVDINECLLGSHSCDNETQTCFIQPGGFVCGCRWGYFFDNITRMCLQHDFLVPKIVEEPTTTPYPCCARYLKSYEDCWEDTSNPCYDIALPGARQCKVNPEENHNFNAMVKNHWNITCNCPDEGYKFKSVFGFCVDINECLLGSHSCDNETQTCFIQPGGFVCGCRWGYFFDNITRMCLQHDFLVPKIVEEPTTTPYPCCARYLKSYEDCWEDTSNPCYDIALPGARQCKVNPEENHNFNAMVKNHWNITCNCPDEGYKFKSVFGFCVDINECLLGSHSCDNETQTCFIQPGGFVCGCRWGYFFDNITRMCLQHDFLVPKIVEEPTTTPYPCCARYLKSYEDCWEDTSNPCYDIALPGARQCKVNPEENHNFNAMVKNHWNITCNCPDEGYKFKSVFGFCVDINECLLGSHSCDNETQTCFIQPGGFVCGCRWGYFFDNITRMCLQHDFLVPKIVEEPTTTPLPLVQRVYNFMHPKCLLRHKEAQANWSRKFESDDFTA